MRSTGRLGTDRQVVHGNRHVGGCCHGVDMKVKPRPPSRSPRHIRRKKRTVVISPALKHENLLREREEEFNNYRNLVEARFT